jgi:hypothetical protein
LKIFGVLVIFFLLWVLVSWGQSNEQQQQYELNHERIILQPRQQIPLLMWSTWYRPLVEVYKLYKCQSLKSTIHYFPAVPVIIAMLLQLKQQYGINVVTFVHSSGSYPYTLLVPQLYTKTTKTWRNLLKTGQQLNCINNITYIMANIRIYHQIL